MYEYTIIHFKDHTYYLENDAFLALQQITILNLKQHATFIINTGTNTVIKAMVDIDQLVLAFLNEKAQTSADHT